MKTSSRVGLWIEIEAVGANSTLKKEHPDWLFTRDGKPIANEPYELRLEFGGSPDKYKQMNQTTNDQGVMEERIPYSATKATLKLTKLGDEIELQVARLDPLDLVAQPREVRRQDRRGHADPRLGERP